jgi:hypothetical protein
MFIRYSPPKYTKYKNNYRNCNYNDIHYEEVCKKCGYRMGDHIGMDCPRSSMYNLPPEFFITSINKNITII